MLELIVLVLFFLSSRFTEWVVLGIILVYGIWAIYMKTYCAETFLKIQAAEDRRRAKVCSAVARGCTNGSRTGSRRRSP